jgi:hypothetical protein
MVARREDKATYDDGLALTTSLHHFLIILSNFKYIKLKLLGFD